MNFLTGQKRKRLAAFALFVAICITFLPGCAKKKDTEEKKTAGLKTAPQPSGYTVTVSEDEQRADDMMTIALKPGLYQKHVEAYGEVLAPEELSGLFKDYTAASSALERAKAQLKASGKEYDRLKALNASNKNVSDKELQASAARFKVDQAEEADASGTLTSAKNTIRLKWGPVISGWVFGCKPALRRVFETKDVLVQITLPPSFSLKGIPERIPLTTPAGINLPARFVSRATSTNPALQGLSFIYIAPSHDGSLVPGMNVTAQMPSSMAQTGFLIPVSAVVWLQDKAWVYVKKSETGFSRIEVPTSTRVNKDYFVSGIFAPGDQVVTRGAQALLAAESTPKTTGGGGDDGDDD